MALVRPGATTADIVDRRLRPGMTFDPKTYWRAADGWSAARIEEELVVAADGCEVIAGDDDPALISSTA